MQRHLLNSHRHGAKKGVRGLWTCSATRWAPVWCGRGAERRPWQQLGGRCGAGRSTESMAYRRNAADVCDWHQWKDLVLFWAGMGQVWTQTGGVGSHPQLAQPECSQSCSESVGWVAHSQGPATYFSAWTLDFTFFFYKANVRLYITIFTAF